MTVSKPSTRITCMFVPLEAKFMSSETHVIAILLSLSTL